MKNIVSAIILALAAVFMAACIHRGEEKTGSEAHITQLISEASAEVESQKFDSAMEKALSALQMAEKQDLPLQKVKALACITGIDIMTSRDSAAWEKALQAEEIARKEGFKDDLSGILISKAKLCSYAEISPETSRNDEGLEYAQEALTLAEEAQSMEKQAEACYVIGSLYINKNRWND